ncbi:HAD family phosphatase [Ruminococcus sp. HUN007]|uniref:HAD family hydrolase n=1 Tax=Ruminococcus sp. HUN007 TaxID=1514668 RepID=UPI000678CD39|nr:HAD family phosphatase [Ruminococcus sp. HUN007]
MIKGVIFDMDGTLIDSMQSWSECDRRFLKENGIDPPPGISEVMKTLSMEECARYFIDLGVKMEPQKITDRIEEMVLDEYSTSIPLKDYVTETLDTLDRYGIPYCIATANYRTLTDTILKRFGIYDRFKFIYTCEENGIKKDDPEFFGKVCALLGTEKESTAVVDDALHCIESAGNAGFFAAAVFDKGNADWEKTSAAADIAFDDLHGFTEFIKAQHQGKNVI